MKVLFIEARKKGDYEAKKLVLSLKASNKIKRVGIAASLQYLNLIEPLKKEFEKRGVKAYFGKGVKTAYEGQIIGCDVKAALRLKKDVDAFVVLSDGRFHAVQLAIEAEKPVFLLQEGSLKIIDNRELGRLQNKRKAALMNFLREDLIGVIVSTKAGQSKLEYAKELEKRIEKKGKKAFLFIGNTINIYELENFPPKVWVNTSCPGLSLDSAKIVNSEDIENFL
jgi:2-(3-amino-3-carboxypropyl)histidine synthase